MTQSFIERQFPVSKVSKESYKERKSSQGQTITGLGKWWGRKPLLLVRTAILGCLLPATDNPEKDTEVFLKIMSMDDEGLLLRKEKKFTIPALYEIVKNNHRLNAKYGNCFYEDGGKIKLDANAPREEIENEAFLTLGYDERIAMCMRPEQLENISLQAWKDINHHLGTDAHTLSELVQQLSIKRSGHNVRVGDCFCGGGSIPFEAARIGCDVYASDLNPIAGLLTWADLHICGADKKELKRIKDFQKKAYDAVDKEIRELGVEHNEKGDRALSYLYCVEADCPECGWRVPLLPSFVVGIRAGRVIVKLHENKRNYEITVHSAVSEKELKEAQNAGTTRNNSLICPHCGKSTPISVLRHDRTNDEGKTEYGLRKWDKDEFESRDSDVYHERLYAIRYEHIDILENGRSKSSRYYCAPSDRDLENENKVHELVKKYFHDWQEEGLVPSTEIESGYNTDQLVRERGWRYWHQLFNSRELFILTRFAEQIKDAESQIQGIVGILGLNRCADFCSKLCRFDPSTDKVAQTFYNQSFNTLMTYGTRALKMLDAQWNYTYKSYYQDKESKVCLSDARDIEDICDLWITDPPYADAVNYHELSEFFLAWDKALLTKVFPDWYTDSKRILAVRGDEHFSQTMIDIYSNLTRHMNDDGMQIVMFTHSNPAVWAQLALIMWKAGLKRIANRHPLTLKGWREQEKPEVAAVAAEEPIYRNEFGLWAHQKYFVMRAFEEHKTKGGARLVLADMVGLGKTLQLAMSAKLMALYGDKPILIIVPKTLLYQWQDEIHTMLDMPSAVWTGKCWRDENGFDYPSDSIQGILKCPRKIGIVSQGIITAKTESAEFLKQLRYECVIVDEAHRARRKNIGKDPNCFRAQSNNLLRFLDEITFQTHSMLLATATPIQIDPIEAYDLLEALGRPNDAVKVLGDKYSVWRKTPQTGLDYISGETEVPQSAAEMWAIVRNPFPQRSKTNRRISIIRDQLDKPDTESVFKQDEFDTYRRPIQNKIWELYRDEEFVQHCNPYVRCIVRRTRDFLENTINKETGEPYLKKINVQLFGEKNNEALELSGYLKQAYSIAEEFCHLLASRVKGGGFMSTLMLKRIGSTMLAGENTAKKMLRWTREGKQTLQEIYDTLTDEDDGDEYIDASEAGEIKNLTAEELDCLARLVNVLKSNKDTDPKYLKVKDILENGVEGEGGWMQKGCIIFSQYFDSANYIAELLSLEMEDALIGIYAGGGKSGIYLNGKFKKCWKDDLKAQVRERKLKILVGTDAASEGLNLQTLSTLINVDLPWNPTRLEQRKGRIQRIGQIADTILIYNMRYMDSVEDRVHTKLSSRLQEIYSMFGQIPDVLEDVWVAMAHNDEKRAMEAINKVPKKNPFIIKYEMGIPNCGDWEKCTDVLDKKEKLVELMKSW